jgi:hypothetical protein
MKRRKNFLKEAIFLLIAVTMVLSTVAVTADTEKSQKTNTLAIVTNSNDNFQQQKSRQEITSRGSGWLYYHNGYNNNAIGLTAGGTYEAAIRFTPTELTGLCDCKLSVVRFYHFVFGGTSETHSCTLKIYEEGTPTEPGDLIYEQPFDATGEGWIYKGLCDPVIIDCEQDLWVSIEVTHAAGEYPIGIDAGPAADQKGDFVYMEEAWDELQNLGLDYNWCIEAYVDCEEEWADHKMHYPQPPDPYGWDVDFGNWRLGDDWKCSETGPVSDIHFWISWWEDVVLDIPWIYVSIWSNNLGPPSTPRIMLWDRIFYEGEFHVKEPQYGQQGWLWPWCDYEKDNHNKYFQIDIENIVDPFTQTACEIYWLVLDMPFDQEMNVGWKTTYEDLHFMDYGVWETEPGYWQPICEPVDLAFVINGNKPPGAPTIIGETEGKVGVEYEYTFNAVDPDGDDVKYFVDWDDGDPEETGFNPSGDDVKLKNTWNSKGTYTITAYAEDTNGLVGPEGTLIVIITKGKNRAINSPFQWFLQQHPYLFPILQMLLFQR